MHCSTIPSESTILVNSSLVREADFPNQILTQKRNSYKRLAGVFFAFLTAAVAFCSVVVVFLFYNTIPPAPRSETSFSAARPSAFLAPIVSQLKGTANKQINNDQGTHTFKRNGAGATAAHAIEMARFRLNDDVASTATFLRHADALYDFFRSTNDTLQRSLTWNETTGEWVDIVYWTTLEAALQAADDILVSPIAQPFLESINASTLQLSHHQIDLDWMPLKKGPIVEVAVFPLMQDAVGSDAKFVKDAKATTSFFQHWSFAAKHRVLAQRYEDSSLWLDLVYWTSVVDALRAATAIEDVPEAQDFLHDMNVSSPLFSFEYFTVALWQDFYN